ncbi:MAG: helix-hairpin-helix domain-containing protein, partial [Candidatus Omnitrophota bacterium]|nr:helix-hairpin-helix domain-containing protein [Candidatus Omnitrophota bacterium]
KAALSPTEVSEVKIDKAAKKIEVVVPDDQLSIGIGKHGQNIRLASRLIGWEMDIRGKEEKKKETEEAKVKVAEEKAGEGEIGVEKGREGKGEGKGKLTDLEGVGPKVEKILKSAGYDTVEKIRALTVEDLKKLDGIGGKTAEKIIKSANES